MPEWHGFGNVGVTPEVQDEIVAWARSVKRHNEAKVIAGLRPCANGLIYLKSPPWLITVFAPEEVA